MTTPSTTQTTAPVVQQKEMVDSVISNISKLTENGLKIPKDYSPENSVRAAWLILQDSVDKSGTPVLQACTKDSIANALLKMVIKGLNPSKAQCAFVAMGNKLTLMEEYAGKIAIAKRVGLKTVTAKVVYEGDTFEFSIDPETGLTKIDKHSSALDNINGGKIRGAYAIITLEDGTRNAEIMTMQQIQAAWNMGASKGQSPAHKGFPDRMCMKTVITRSVNILINSSDDANLYVDDDEPEIPNKEVKEEIRKNANASTMAFEDATVVQADASAAPAPKVEPKEEIKMDIPF